MTLPARESFVFFGAYDSAYPRNAVIRRGLLQNGALVREVRVSTRWKFWARYPLLVGGYLKGRAASAGNGGSGRADCRRLFVPEFCAKDVPLAALLSLLSAKTLVFDPLAARYETKILDWRRRAPSSLTAWWNFRIDAAAFRLSRLILADTAAHKEYYGRTYRVDPARIEVLPVGYDDSIFQPLEAPPGRPKELVVLFFGSFLPLHGADIIAEAAGLLAKEPGLLFRVIGEGQTFPAFKSSVEARGLRNVEFLGRVPIRRLPAEIAAADLCLGAFGRTEKSRRVVPHKVYQAMAMGRAVITARSPAVEEFFTHRGSAFFCDEPLAASLALAILELKRDAGLREAIAAEGLRLVREKFSPQAIGRRLLEILSSR